MNSIFPVKEKLMMKFSTRFIFIGTFFSALTFLSSLHSQISTTTQNAGGMENYISMGDIQMVSTFDDRYQGVKGTPLVFEDWTEGYVLFKDKPEEKEEEVKTFKMNIDMFQNILYVTLYNGAIGTLPTKFVSSVHFKTAEGKERIFKPMVRKEVESSNFPGFGYYEIIHEGDMLLLKHHRKIFQEADYKGAYSADVRYDEYKDEKRYFISFDGQTFEKIKLKSKYLEKVMPQYDLKALSKKEKLNLSKEEDVKKLLSMLEEGS
jgi:hypothetical protein